MAGRARTQAITAAFDRRVKDTFDPQPEDEVQPDSLDYVCHMVETPMTVKALAADMQRSLPFDFDYAMLMRYLRSLYGDRAADQRVEEARARASHSLAEDAIDIVDRPAETMMDVSRATSRAKARQWAAERYNPSKYGSQKGVSVSVTVGSLHLDALRAVSTIVTGSAQPALPSPAHNSAELGEVLAVHSVSS